MPLPIDKNLVKQRFRRCLATYDSNAAVQRQMAEHLVHLLRTRSGVPHSRTIEVGAGSGILTRMAAESLHMRSMWVNDLVPECRRQTESLAKAFPHIAFTFLPGDIESTMDLPTELDLVLSNAAFQWIQDLPRLLARLTVLLKPGGVLAFGTFGPGNLVEVRGATGDSLRYHDKDALCRMLPRSMTLLAAEEKTTVLHFASPREVLEHIRNTGSNALAARPWTRASLAEFDRKYRSASQSEGRVTLTYHPILVVARKARVANPEDD